MLHFTISNLLSHKLRLFLTSFVILLGVAFVSGALILSSTLNRTFDDLFANVYKNVDVVVRTTAPNANLETTRPKIDASVIDTVRTVDGVAKAEGYYEGFAQVVGKNGKVVGGNGPPTFGAPWSNDPDFNPFAISEGRAPVADDEVVIDKSTATRGSLVVGDQVQIISTTAPQTLRLVGLATFGGADSPGGTSYAFFNQSTALRTVGEPGKFDVISLVAREGVSQEELRDRVSAALPTQAEAITGKAITEELQNSLKEGLSFIGQIPLIFAGIALFVGAFIINNTFSILVAQRTKEMALLRAIGARRRQVLWSVVAESLVVGLIASVLGFFAGIAVAYGLLAVMNLLGFSLSSTGLTISPSTAYISLLAGVVITAVAAYLPARRGSNVPPIAALQDVAMERTGASKKRIVLGLLIAVAGFALLVFVAQSDANRRYIPAAAGAALAFIGVYVLGPVIARPLVALIGWPLARLRGLSGGLARQNAQRNPRRTSATAAALMIGVTLVTLASVFTASAKDSVSKVLDESFQSDFIVQGANNFMGDLSPDLYTKLSQLPEIELASSLRFEMPVLDGSTQPVTSFEPSSFLSIMKVPVSQGSLQSLGLGDIAVYRNTADDRGWKIGQEIPVVFAGGDTRALRLAAIYDDQSVLGGYAISHQTYDANVARPLDAQIMLNKRPEMTAAAARDAVEAVTDTYPNANVKNQAEFKEQIAGSIDQVLTFVLGFLALAIVIALLGIATTLALSVFERTRELGLLRAVGMSRRQVRSMVTWESVIISLLGTVLGFGLGIIFGMSIVKALADQGLTELTIPIGRLLLVAVAAAIAGVLAAVYPARRAARLNVLDAVSTT